MKHFTALLTALDESSTDHEAIAAIRHFFREADARDAAWALHFLSGRKMSRCVSAASLRAWAAEASSLPEWLVDECAETVGDVAEALALILPDGTEALRLYELIEQRLLRARGASESVQKLLVLATWLALGTRERVIWNQLLLGTFRSPVAARVVVGAIAAIAGIEPPLMAYRIAGDWLPTAENFGRLIDETPDAHAAIVRPYPFQLSVALDLPLPALGPATDWQIEWKWGGLRAQIIRRGGESLVWSADEEWLTQPFPEVARAADAIPDGTVLDGELVAWIGGSPAPFSRLQRRLGLKNPSTKKSGALPVVFIASDLLEWNSEDWRPRPLVERRRQLEAVVSQLRAPDRFDDAPDLFGVATEPAASLAVVRVSEILPAADWDSAAAYRDDARARHVGGLLIKRRAAPYGAGREIGDGWEWSVEPLVLKVVLINAQLGDGARAHLYSHYTVGLWSDGNLVPVAKTDSGLSDADCAKVDAFVRSHITAKFGPIRAVQPELVFELAFDSVRPSSRHKIGIALDRPRLHRCRLDVAPSEADSIETLRALLPREDFDDRAGGELPD